MSGRARGCIVRALGASAVAALPGARLGDGVRVVTRTGSIACRVAAVERSRVALVPFGSLRGAAVGDVVELDPHALSAVLGFGVLGRALDASGAPLDGGEAPRGARVAAGRSAPAPAQRAPIDRPLWTGIRALDGLLVAGRGARVGIFGPPGCGKTSLLNALAASVEVDAVAIALVGERGREAETWCARLDGRTTLFCATSDRSAAERVRVTELAFAHGAHLRERGLHAAIVLDSLARYAAALRELRLSAGEALGPGGYPPGVWAELAAIVERAGNARGGSLTLFATVLTDGDDERDPVALAARSLLDAHITLSATHARAGRFPAIDVSASLSRTMADVVSAAQLRDAAVVREALDVLESTRELRRAGLADISEPRLAGALAAEADLEAFVHRTEPGPPGDSIEALHELARSLRH
jgi:type III secretion protein N (ATPase)